MLIIPIVRIMRRFRTGLLKLIDASTRGKVPHRPHRSEAYASLRGDNLPPVAMPCKAPSKGGGPRGWHIRYMRNYAPPEADRVSLENGEIVNALGPLLTILAGRALRGNACGVSLPRADCGAAGRIPAHLLEHGLQLVGDRHHRGTEAQRQGLHAACGRPNGNREFKICRTRSQFSFTSSL